MYQIIITVIAVVLAAALAGTALYYGGDAMLGSRHQVEATRLFNDSKQIVAAYWQWRGDFMEDPVDTAEDPSFLVTDAYLNQIPQSDWLEDQARGAGAVTAWTLTPGYVATGVGNLAGDTANCDYAIRVCREARAELGYQAPGDPPSCSAASGATLYTTLQSGGFMLSCGTGDPALDAANYGSSVAFPDDPCCVCTPDIAGVNPVCARPSG